MGSRIHGVLFDVDDTLFDRRRAQDMALQLIVREFPDLFKGMEHRQVRQAFTESDRTTCEEYDTGALTEDPRTRRSKLFLEMLGLDQAFAQEISDLYVARYPTVNAPVPGALSVVQNLASCFKLGVVSNGWPDVQYRKLEALGIRECFECVVLSEEVGVQKPHPEIFHHAASLLELRPETCLYVGDLFDIDVVGANRARMYTCWFNPGREQPPTGEISADAEIDELAALVHRIQEMNFTTIVSSQRRGRRG